MQFRSHVDRLSEANARAAGAAVFHARAARVQCSALVLPRGFDHDHTAIRGSGAFSIIDFRPFREPFCSHSIQAPRVTRLLAAGPQTLCARGMPIFLARKALSDGVL